jgi:hypothetical protein
VPVNPADSSHIALDEPSAQCFASGLHLCFLCSAKWLKLRESSPASVLLEDPQEGDGWALWAAKPLDRGLEIFLLEVAACDTSRVVGQPYLAGLWKGCPLLGRFKTPHAARGATNCSLQNGVVRNYELLVIGATLFPGKIDHDDLRVFA